MRKLILYLMAVLSTAAGLCAQVAITSTTSGQADLFGSTATEFTLEYSLQDESANRVLAVGFFWNNGSLTTDVTDLSAITFGGVPADGIENRGALAVAYWFNPTGSNFSGTVTRGVAGREAWIIHELANVDTRVAPVISNTVDPVGAAWTLSTASPNSTILNWISVRADSFRVANQDPFDSVTLTKRAEVAVERIGSSATPGDLIGRIASGTAAAAMVGTYGIGWNPGGNSDVGIALSFTAEPAQQTGGGEIRYPGQASPHSPFTVTVNGTAVPVVACMDYYYVHFGFSGEVNLEVQTTVPIQQARISPQSLGLAHTLTSTHSLSFSMEQVAGQAETPRYLMLQINDLPSLVILGDPPETNVPPASGIGIFNVVAGYGADPTGATYTQPAIQNAINAASAFGSPANRGIVYIPQGTFMVRANLLLKSNVDLYLAPGAILKADENPDNYDSSIKSINGTIDAVLVVDDASNVTIRGRGIVDASGVALMNLFSQPTPVFLEQSAIHPRRRIIQTSSSGTSSTVRIEGIIAKDATGWSVEVLRTDGATVQNVKVLNHRDIRWKIQNDGINATSSSNTLINQCFVLTIDDAMCAKARFDSWGTMRNVTFSNNVLWSWAAGVKSGMQHYHPMENIRFENIDIIHARRAVALDTRQGDSNDPPVGNTVFHNIRVEDLNPHWDNSSTPAIEFQLDTGPAENVVVSNLTLAEAHPVRVFGSYGARNVTIHNLLMDGRLYTSVGDLGALFIDSQPIENLTITFSSVGPNPGLDPDNAPYVGSANLHLWLDAGTLALNDGAAVTSWIDGEQFHSFTGTGSYVADFLNGRPGVRFDGVDDTLMAAIASGLSPARFTLFVVAGFTTTAADGTSEYLISSQFPTNTNSRLRIYKAGNDGLLDARVGGGSTMGDVAQTPLLPQIYTLISGRSGNGVEFLIDTVVKATGTSGTSVDPIQRLALGSFGGNSQFMDGTIAEVLLYDGPLSEIDTMIIHDYLLKKYSGVRLDGDLDGLPDLWELQWFGTLDASSGGTGDLDNDGSTDKEEWLFGTDPTDEGSGMDGRSVLSFLAGLDGLELQARPGIVYDVQRSGDLIEWETIGRYGPYPTAQELIIDFSFADAAPVFFRSVVRPEYPVRAAPVAQP
jgi:hypothetical protein